LYKIPKHKFNISFENHAFYVIMWKSIVRPCKPLVTIMVMLSACWIPKSTNTHSEYVILIVFPPQNFFHEGASMVCYT